MPSLSHPTPSNRIQASILTHLLNLVPKGHLGTKEVGLDHMWVWNYLQWEQKHRIRSLTQRIEEDWNDIRHRALRIDVTKVSRYAINNLISYTKDPIRIWSLIRISWRNSISCTNFLYEFDPVYKSLRQIWSHTNFILYEGSLRNRMLWHAPSGIDEMKVSQ